MNVAGKMIASLALAAVVSGAARAAEGSPSGNPYAAVVARNIFGLVPIPVSNAAEELPPPEPPPKITPNGIMSIFGKLQVLFKVPGKPVAGQPAKDESYVLCEGERQDEIEVQKIDEKAGTVTFNNHGVIQELALVVGAATGPVGGPGGGPKMPAGFAPGSFAVPPMPRLAPAMGGVPAGAGGRMNPSSASSGQPVFGGGMPFSNQSAGAAKAPEETLTPEAQILIMEHQRSDWLKTGGPAMIMPPTPITHLIEQDAK